MSCIYATFTTQVSELLFGQEILSNNHITSIQYMFQIPKPETRNVNCQGLPTFLNHTVHNLRSSDALSQEMFPFSNQMNTQWKESIKEFILLVTMGYQAL